MAEQNAKITIAKQLKSELSNIQYSDTELKGLVSGFVRNGGTFSLGANNSSLLRVKTEIASAARIVYKVFKNAYKLDTHIVYENNNKFSKKIVYTVVASGNVLDIVEDLEIRKDLMECNVEKMLTLPYIRGFIAGCFIGSGSLSDPNKSYYIEISFNDMEVANTVKNRLNSLYLDIDDLEHYNWKTIQRRNHAVLYMKKSEYISNFLSYLGATNIMLQFETIRIERDYYNNENRLIICDSHNYSKAALKGQENIDLINKVLKVRSLEYFDSKVQALIKLRLEFPDASYSELSDRLRQMGVSMSKSSINNAFNKLKEIVK